MPVVKPPIKPIIQTAVGVAKLVCPSPSITIRPFDKSNRIDFSCR